MNKTQSYADRSIITIMMRAHASGSEIDCVMWAMQAQQRAMTVQQVQC